LVRRGTPAAVDEELDPVVCGIRCSLAQGTEESRIEVGYGRKIVLEDRRAVGEGNISLAKRTRVLTGKTTMLTAKTRRTRGLTVECTALTATDVGGWCDRRGRGRQQLVAVGCDDRPDDDQQAGDKDPANPNATGRRSCWLPVGHAAIEGSAVLPARMRFSICRRYVPARSLRACVCCSLRTNP
jgi:hypothetical protein